MPKGFARTNVADDDHLPADLAPGAHTRAVASYAVQGRSRPWVEGGRTHLPIMTANADPPSPLVDFIAGTVAGVASLLAGHPFDTIKTRLQSQPFLPSGSPGLDGRVKPAAAYQSAMDAYRIIVRDERFIGLYKGVTSPLLGVAIMNASVFGCYSLALRAQLGANEPVEHASLGQIMLAGMASGVMTALITAPIDLVKIRQQNDTRTGTLPSTISVIRDILRTQGVTGLFRGYRITCIRDLGYGPYFFTYELLNRTLLSLHSTATYSHTSSITTASSALPSRPDQAPSPSPRLSPLELAIAGGLAGMVGWAVTFWADVIKTRIQATEAGTTGRSIAATSTSATSAAYASASSGPSSAGATSRAVRTTLIGSEGNLRKANNVTTSETDRLLGPRAASSFSNPPSTSVHPTSAVSPSSHSSWLARRSEIVRVALDIHRTGGWRAFWVGIGPTMLRALPTNAVLFIVYEATKSACIDWGI